MKLKFIPMVMLAAASFFGSVTTINAQTKPKAKTETKQDKKEPNLGGVQNPVKEKKANVEAPQEKGAKNMYYREVENFQKAHPNAVVDEARYEGADQEKSMYKFGTFKNADRRFYQQLRMPGRKIVAENDAQKFYYAPDTLITFFALGNNGIDVEQEGVETGAVGYKKAVQGLKKDKTGYHNDFDDNNIVSTGLYIQAKGQKTSFVRFDYQIAETRDSKPHIDFDAQVQKYRSATDKNPLGDNINKTGTFGDSTTKSRQMMNYFTTASKSLLKNVNFTGYDAWTPEHGGEWVGYNFVTKTIQEVTDAINEGGKVFDLKLPERTPPAPKGLNIK